MSAGAADPSTFPSLSAHAACHPKLLPLTPRAPEEFPTLERLLLLNGGNENCHENTDLLTARPSEVMTLEIILTMNDFLTYAGLKNHSELLANETLDSLGSAMLSRPRLLR